MARATRAAASLVVALALGAALAPAASAASLDLDRWDEFMAAAGKATFATLAPRDTAALDTADVRWLAGASVAEPRALDRRWVTRLRRAFAHVALETPAPCLATAYRWGCLGSEREVPVVSFRLDAEVLRIAFLPREHAAVFALDDRPVGCLRLDLGVAPWTDLLGVPPRMEGDDDPPPYVDELAYVLVQVAPDRGSDARAMGLGGSVRVKARVGMDGSVLGASALDGPEMLHGPAIACVMRWRFEPARFEGRPVTSLIVTTVRFE